MRKTILLFFAISSSLIAFSYDWDDIEIPAVDKDGWTLQTNLSDDFNYSASFSSGGFSSKSDFGDGKWYNFYHNPWDGPGTTYWNTSQVSVDGDNLVITVAKNSSTSKMGMTGVTSGCVTSKNKVSIGSYVEASLSVANITLASCFWLLSPDDTQEIDIIENYGATEWYGSYTHISHHSFRRPNGTYYDYQPRDKNSWYSVPGVSNWGEYCWNDGDRVYMRMGVYWRGPNHFEYYINGEMVRVMYHNATATLKSSRWYYQYFNSTYKDDAGNTFPQNNSDGYTDVTAHSSSFLEFDFAKLQAASDASNNISVIDPGNFQGGNGFTKDLDIIINMESQDWLATNHTPSDEDLANSAKNQMKVDWVRVYKPIGGADEISTSISDLKKNNLNIYPNPTSGIIYIETESNLSEPIEVYSATGLKVFEVEFSNQINLSSLNKGIYLIKIGNTSKRIAIE